MSTKLSRAEAIALVRKAEEDSSPVELVGVGPSEQAVHLIGFLSFQEEGAIVSVRVPEAVGAFFSISDCDYEYIDPREARPAERARAQSLLDFMLSFTTGEWQYMIRVWKRPGTR